jgi:hypothetical protein
MGFSMYFFNALLLYWAASISSRLAKLLSPGGWQNRVNNQQDKHLPKSWLAVRMPDNTSLCCWKHSWARPGSS